MCLLVLVGLPLVAFILLLLVGLIVLILDKIVLIALIVSALYVGKKLVDKRLS